MKYESYRYLWPPRPEKAIPRNMLSLFGKSGYVGQIKKNGTCTVIFCVEDKVIFKTRHNEDHKAWSASAEIVEFFRAHQGSVFVAELLHSKVPGIRDQLYIFDIIVKDGVQLADTAFEDRQKILRSIWRGTEERDCFRVHPNVTVAKTFTYSQFDVMWSNLQLEDEGFVLKRLSGKLSNCLRQNCDQTWQVKCRKPTKNYSF